MTREISDWVDYEYDELKHETEQSWLIVIEGDEYWLPKSQCEIDKKKCLISIPDWLAKERGLPPA